MPTYTILVFYKLKRMTEEEEERARREWDEIMADWPPEIRFLGVYDHAWGTKYNGFILLETEDMDSYVRFWRWFKDKVRWYVEETRTVISLKR